MSDLEYNRNARENVTLYEWVFCEIILHADLRISNIFRTFVYELRQGLNPTSINPLTLQQTKNIDL